MDPDNSAKTGQKRKRYEPPQKELGVRVQQKLYHEKKEVHRASKRARTFETQKVVKKLKDLRRKSDDKKAIENSEAELTSLKTIDHDTIGNSALRTKILKDHTLRDHADVKMALESELSGSTLVVPAEPGTPLAKIQSRLLSSKILAQQVAASVMALKVLLNPELVQGSNNVDVGVENGRAAKIAKTSRGDKKSAVQPPAAAADGDEDDDDDAVDPDPDSDSDARVDFLDDEDEGGGDDGWESGSIADGVTPGHGHEVSSDDNDDSSDSDARSDQEDSDDDDGDQAERSTRPTKAKTLSSSTGANDAAKAGKGKTTTSSSLGESTFLPSLSVGYIKGSDDEDFDDGDDDDKPKKNRRGQRARRAIWEKKFGRNANHKKKEAEEMAVKKKMQAAKANGRPINTGANAIQASRVGGGGPNRSRQQQQQPIDGGWKGRTEAMNAPPVIRKPAPSEKPLHPSWEAKRRLREKESAGIVPAQGKKIKF